MSTIAIRKIDEFGRLLLPTKLRAHLKWEPGDELISLVDTATGRLVLYKSSPGRIEIDTHGRITIAPRLQSQLGWKTGDEVKIKLMVKEERLVLYV